VTLDTLTIAADHPAFAGHFPGAPILPGVVLLDAALHAAGSTQPAAIWQIVTAKFHNIVRPGEVLTLERETLPEGVVRFFIRTATTAGAASGRLVASGTLRSGAASAQEGRHG
jgi:3-hydroxymyristoyl/3-hydroxydecanoyl-(acyl carrier protein) dehydratase